MVRRPRRPLRRAAMVGGTVYGAGPKPQGGREQALAARTDGLADAGLDRPEQLQEAGVLTQDELDDRIRRLRQGA